MYDYNELSHPVYGTAALANSYTIPQSRFSVSPADVNNKNGLT